MYFLPLHENKSKGFTKKGRPRKVTLGRQLPVGEVMIFEMMLPQKNSGK